MEAFAAGAKRDLVVWEGSIGSVNGMVKVGFSRFARGCDSVLGSIARRT